MRAKWRADARRCSPSTGWHCRLEVHLLESWEMLTRPFLLHHLGHLHIPHCLWAPLPALSAPVPPGYPGQATFSQQLLSSPLSPRDAPTPWCLLHLVQTLQHPRSLHSLHPQPAGFSQGLSTPGSFTCLPLLTLVFSFMPSPHREVPSSKNGKVL